MRHARPLAALALLATLDAPARAAEAPSALCRAEPAIRALADAAGALDARDDGAAARVYLATLRAHALALTDLAAEAPGTADGVLARFVAAHVLAADLVAAGDAEAAGRLLRTEPMRGFLDGVPAHLEASGCTGATAAAPFVPAGAVAEAAAPTNAPPTAAAPTTGSMTRPAAAPARSGTEATAASSFASPGGLAVAGLAALGLILAGGSLVLRRERRADIRTPCNVESVLIARGQALRTRIRDIGCAGAKVEIPPDSVAVSEPIELCLAGRVQASKVIWHTRFYAGVQFTVRISDETAAATAAAAAIAPPAHDHRFANLVPAATAAHPDRFDALVRRAMRDHSGTPPKQ